MATTVDIVQWSDQGFYGSADVRDMDTDMIVGTLFVQHRNEDRWFYRDNLCENIGNVVPTGAETEEDAISWALEINPYPFYTVRIDNPQDMDTHTVPHAALPRSQALRMARCRWEDELWNREWEEDPHACASVLVWRHNGDGDAQLIWRDGNDVA